VLPSRVSQKPLSQPPELHPELLAELLVHPLWRDGKLAFFPQQRDLLSELLFFVVGFLRRVWTHPVYVADDAVSRRVADHDELMEATGDGERRGMAGVVGDGGWRDATVD